MTPPASSIWWAWAASAKGTVACTTGVTRPSANIGHNRATTSAHRAALPCAPATGRPRSPIAATLARLGNNAPRFELGGGAALQADHY